MTDKSEEETHFLNVDLDLESSESLAPLIAALESVAHTLHDEKTAISHRASLELGYSGPIDAEATIQGFTTAVTALPKDARARWDKASMRRFSIGLQAGVRPHSFQITLQAHTLQAVAALAGTLEIVVYAPYPRPKLDGVTPSVE